MKWIPGAKKFLLRINSKEHLKLWQDVTDRCDTAKPKIEKTSLIFALLEDWLKRSRKRTGIGMLLLLAGLVDLYACSGPVSPSPTVSACLVHHAAQTVCNAVPDPSGAVIVICTTTPAYNERIPVPPTGCPAGSTPLP